MSCNGCTIGPGNKPHGCKSNGSCSNGGCNRMNVHDWLADIPVVDTLDVPRFVEVSFKNGARKDFYRNMHRLLIDSHDVVAVESGTGGYDMGVVSMTGEMVKLQMKRKRVPENSDDIKGVIRKANDWDLKKWEEIRVKEKETMVRARATARQLGLEMKIGDVEFQGDGRKATFYYTADDRVDFRELIKIFAKEFHVKVDMHQIGARQEAGRIGGIGSCGRELCCSTWLTDFKTVGTAAARYQQLSINQAKLSGQCGRLKCCLNYELDTYMDALKDIPVDVEKIETETGMAYLQKTDIFKRLMWFAYKNSSVFHPLTPDRVKEISMMNKSGQKPPDLGAVQLSLKKEKEEEAYVEVVGQVSLESLDKKTKKKKKRSKHHHRPNRPR
ncbi:MAG TPA: regulatory iron-sulfur-containing complex subunit RicT [Chitinophagales bacterium]|nr:regulatory iron-sulfur-containing complex subunit RicT [Chitinophagales bacterium]